MGLFEISLASRSIKFEGEALQTEGFENKFVKRFNFSVRTK